MSKLAVLTTFLAGLLLNHQQVDAHPKLLGCNALLNVGDSHMRSNNIQADPNVNVRFVVNGQQVECGSQFNAGDDITVTHNIVASEYFVEVIGGVWKTPNYTPCTKRQYNQSPTTYSQSKITVNANANTLTVYAGFANGETSLKLTQRCTITKRVTAAPTKAPTASPVIKIDFVVDPWTSAGDFSADLETGSADVNIGDKIVFQSDATQTSVFRMKDKEAFDNCDFTDAIGYEFDSENKVTVVIRRDMIFLDTDKIYFASATDDLCSTNKLKVFFNPLFAAPPTNAPTSSPTLFPTQSPVIPSRLKLQWDISDPAFKSQQTVAVNDEIQLYFPSATNSIVQFPDLASYQACNFAANGVQTLTTDNAEEYYSVYVDAADQGDFIFLGSQQTLDDGTYCDAGLKLQLKVVKQVDPIQITWKVALDASVKAGILLQEGQSIQFNPDSPVHNIFEFKSKAAFDACDFSAEGATLIDNSGTSALVRDSVLVPGQVTWYGCAAAAHCASGGQKFKVTIIEQPQEPTSAPSQPPPAATPAPLSELTGDPEMAVLIAAVVFLAVGALMLVFTKGGNFKEGLFGVSEEALKQKKESSEKKDEVAAVTL